MSDILLVNCPPWGVVMPPLSIAYLSTYLKSKHKDCRVYDLNLELYKKASDCQKQFWDLDLINRFSPIDIANNLFSDFKKEISFFVENLQESRVIGFSANNFISATVAGLIAERIKTSLPEKIIIMGGPGCFHSWDRGTIAKHAVDFFVIGEGEEVLLELLNRIKGKNDISGMRIKIPGLIQNSHSKKYQFYPPTPIKDINQIPFPTFEEFDLPAYNYGKKYRPLPLLMSRGCINRCSYCIDWYMCASFRVRKPENIITEIKHHIEKYNVRDVEFNDLLCNGNLTQLEKFCDLLIANNLNVNWISYAVVRKDMTKKLLSKMERSGCRSLCFGVESGSDAVLKKMNKHYTKEDAARLIKRVHEAKIEVRMNIIVGFPGETEDDFQQTLKFIKENNEFIDEVTNVSAFVHMPGSDLAIYPHDFGISYRDETNLETWTDANKTTQKTRNARVQETCQLINALGINNLIVNYQKERKCKSDVGKIDQLSTEEIKNEISNSWNCIDIHNSVRHRKSFFKRCKLFFLFVFSVIIDIYLAIIKRIRGSIIFRGS